MPSINAIATMAAMAGGAAVLGGAAWKHSGKDESMDTSDRAGYTGSAVIAGAGGGLALKAIGLRNLGKMAGKAATGANYARKALMSNPTGAGLKRIPKGAGKPLAMLALLSASVGAIAYGSRSSKLQNTTNASRDGTSGTEYNTRPIKERMTMMGATGDMVFGLNNMRHG